MAWHTGGLGGEARREGRRVGQGVGDRLKGGSEGAALPLQVVLALPLPGRLPQHLHPQRPRLRPGRHLPCAGGTF